MAVRRPLAEATEQRIYNGIKRFVEKDPFIISVAHGYSGGRREYPGDEPLGTVTSGGVAHALVTPYLAHIQNASNKFGCMPPDEPLRTITANPKGGGIALVAPIIDRQFGMSKGNSAEDPLGTVTSNGGGSSAWFPPSWRNIIPA